MKIISLTKISEFHACQWEAELEDGNFLYARVRYDRLTIGIGESPQKAMRNGISFPVVDTYVVRPDWEEAYSTQEILRKFNRHGYDCSKINAEQVEAEYKDVSI